jgi:putative GTP pyrophosphokinase
VLDEFGLSKGTIDRAGDELRAWWSLPRGSAAETPEPGAEDLETEQAPDPFPTEAADVLFAYRAQFPDPLKKVTVGLRQFVDRESPGARVTVGQRLKRAPQIVDKLWRHSGMKLSRMQDIGGCRAILRDEDEVRRVALRIERNWGVKHRKHYTFDDPAPSGYRALHIIVERDGRLIEIQLRTLRQHDWAEAIERTDKRLGINLKSGDGPAELLEYFRLAADGLATEEAALTADPTFLRDFNRARERAQKYFTGG